MSKRTSVVLPLQGILPILCAVAALAAGCRSAGTGGPIVGRVVDPQGKPVAGAEVSVNGGAATKTRSNGAFSLRRVPSSPRLAVSATAPGFVRTTTIVPAPTRGAINGVAIWPRAKPVRLQSEDGGTVKFAGNGSLSIPANSLVDDRGQPVTGAVDVSVTYFDVSDPAQLRAAPGDFSARMLDRSQRQLESFGIVEIHVTAAGGRRAELARGRDAEIRIPIPRAYLDRAPERVRSFSFDSRTGYWTEAGGLVRAGLVYTGTIDRFDWSWNADDPLDTACMTFKVVRPWQNDQPEPNCRVEATGVTYGSVSYGYTDAAGLVCLLVKRNDQVDIRAFSTLNQNYLSVPVVVTTPNIAAGPADCGDPLKCPLTDIPLDIIVGGGVR